MVDNLFELRRADQKLALSKEVIACWSASGFTYCGRGEITALARDKVTVRLLEPVGNYGEYPGGSQISVPRFTDQTRWSSRNCVRLIEAADRPPG